MKRNLDTMNYDNLEVLQFRQLAYVLEMKESELRSALVSKWITAPVFRSGKQHYLLTEAAVEAGIGTIEHVERYKMSVPYNLFNRSVVVKYLDGEMMLEEPKDEYEDLPF